MSHFGSAIASLCVMHAKPGMLLAALFVVAAGCARQPGHQEANAALAEPPAYCQPRPAPDCEFRNTSLKPVDSAEFARLKLAYEKRCVRRAEKVERERLRELQAAGACVGRPAPALAGQPVVF